ncbi:hypothetical protein PF008_g13994 [Phytophthora fragariae]|uniref:Uncharacterized protein n=1 Tax=Phytophthora fragariae TaxID=53985 RepID=A0A6G0RIS9_9STRA|nr:hypothetical protein PF008_g13994 [Phytophthora fragariae]
MNSAAPPTVALPVPAPPATTAAKASRVPNAPKTPTASKAAQALRVSKKVPSSGGVGPLSSRPIHERLVTACPPTPAPSPPAANPAPGLAQSAVVFQPAYSSPLPPAASLVQPAAATLALREPPAQETGRVTGLPILASAPPLTAPAPESGSGRHLTPAGPVIDVDDSDSENESFAGSLQPVARPPSRRTNLDNHRLTSARGLRTHATPSPSRAPAAAYTSFDLSEFLSQFHAGAVATPSIARIPCCHSCCCRLRELRSDYAG